MNQIDLLDKVGSLTGQWPDSLCASQQVQPGHRGLIGQRKLTRVTEIRQLQRHLDEGVGAHLHNRQYKHMITNQCNQAK